MSAPSIPVDPLAEATVVACAVATAHGAVLAHERVRAGDFYTPRYAWLFEATKKLVDVEPHAERVAKAAALAGVDEAEVERLLDDRALQWDSGGTFASRVKAAAERRRALAVLADTYNALGAGASLAEVRERLRELAA